MAEFQELGFATERQFSRVLVYFLGAIDYLITSFIYNFKEKS